MIVYVVTKETEEYEPGFLDGGEYGMRVYKRKEIDCAFRSLDDADKYCREENNRWKYFSYEYEGVVVE